MRMSHQTVARLYVALILMTSGQHCFGQQPSAYAREEWWNNHKPKAVSLYHWLHEHPEISLEEKGTANKLAAAWREAGLTVATNVGGHGIVGIYKNGDGPTVMLRTDLDALPVLEATSLPYSSKNTGVMHACGHDIHMANAAAVGHFLVDKKDAWAGTLMLIGQPAEERGLGANMMLRDGLFQRFPKPDFGLAIHVDGGIPPGVIKTAAGYVGASSDSVDITVKGRGGHGSAPHTTIDPIVQAADLIMSLQTIVSRETKPTDAAVVTVGSIKGGTKHNIISDDCRLQLTVRSHNEEVRSHLIKSIRRRALGIAQAYGAPAPTVTVSEGVPALRNDPQVAARLKQVFVGLLGEANVRVAKRTMGFEDFSQFGFAGVPILMYGVGSVSQQRLDHYEQAGGIPSLHSAGYYPDAEQTLETAFMTASVAMIELFAGDK